MTEPIKEVHIKRLAGFARKIAEGERLGKRYYPFYGGSGSGKSHSIAQHIAFTFLKIPDLHILVTRKTLPALRLSAYPLVRRMLDEMQVPYELNKSSLDLTYKDSTIFFRSLDDPEKIKSAEFNFIWMEEATDFTVEDWRQFDLRLRRPHPTFKPEMFLTFNPIDAFHFIITDLVQTQDPEMKAKTCVMHSTYKDNPFLPQATVELLKSYERMDRNFYRIYTLGEPGIIENIIYSNYEITDLALMPLKVREFPPDFMGLDFGFNNPTGAVGVWRVDAVTYIREMLYRTRMTNHDIIAWLRSLKFKHGPNEVPLPASCAIFADPSRPDQIEEICREGFNCKPADNPIAQGIDHVKSVRWVVDDGSVNLLKEARTYKYAEDKEGHPYDVPVDLFNHLMDSIRYALYTNRTMTGVDRMTRYDVDRAPDVPIFFDDVDNLPGL